MEKPIIIIGAGVAGLTAAIEAERAGYSPLILEGSDRIGGRVKTDQVDGFLLDHGFQVLLTAYREVERYLDIEALNLQRFAPGAIIFDGKRSFRISDPLRNPGTFPRMAFSPVGTLRDKWLIWKLTRELERQSRESLFAENRQTTIDFLRSYGFSNRIIERFFRPFFGGIFLENELRTAAAMFRFVFKMFGEGYAAIPAAGMEAIPEQLKSQLQQTQIRFNSPIENIEKQEVILKGGERLPFSRLILATDPSGLIARLQGQEQSYVHTSNLYFSADHSPLSEPAIALVADPASPVNNWCVLTDVTPSYGPSGKALISVTLKDRPAKADVPAPSAIASELQRLTKQPGLKLTFLARYDIPRALPEISDLRYDLPPSQARLTNNIFLAGDYLLNASLDAAMRSGRNAVLAMQEVE